MDFLWKEYLRAPWQWSNSKVTACADLKHKMIKESLWDPSWVRTELRVGKQNDKAAISNCPNAEDAASVALLRACAKTKDLYRGSRVHAHLLKRGLLENSSYVVEDLVSMYAKCGALAKAQDLLDEFSVRNVFAWTALIAGYAQQGQGHAALHCFARMQLEGLSPSAVTFACILKACGNIGALAEGEQIHDDIVQRGLLKENIVLGTSLVDMYAKCGAFAKAQQVLEELPARDVFSWTALISGFANHGQGQDALICLERMEREALSPNAVTYACILKACGSVGAVDKGKQIHDKVAKQGLLGNNIVLGTALVDMYAKCGALAKAQQVLEELPTRNVFSWNALIAGYVHHRQGRDALNCFERMRHEGISPSLVTFACILNACGSIRAVYKGEQIHDEIAKQGLLEDSIVLGTALVDMYAKCGALAKARQVLEELPARNVVSWTALIEGYAQQGQGESALNCFERMQREGLSPNAVTYACILKACGSIGATDKGGKIHDEIARQGLLRTNVVLGTVLVGMYAKCGALAKARRVLEELPAWDAVSWNVIIAGYAQQGQSQDALNCFEQMLHKGLSPDACTLGCILNACSHSGLVDEGLVYFTNMSTRYGMEPNLEHYTCMVDLLGRAGHLERAAALIQKLPCYDYCVAWHALLGACRKWQDVSVGKWAFEHAVQVEKGDAAAYVLMANIYAAAGMQEDAKSIEAMRVENKAWKKGGCRWGGDMKGIAHYARQPRPFSTCSLSNAASALDSNGFHFPFGHHFTAHQLPHMRTYLTRQAMHKKFWAFSLWEGGPFSLMFSYSVQHHELLRMRLRIPS